MRLAAKTMRPRLVISEKDGKWTIKSENTFKTISTDITPGVQLNNRTPDGREFTVYLLLFIFLIMSIVSVLYSR